MFFPSSHLTSSQDESKFFLEHEGRGRQLQHMGVQVQETRGPQTSHDGGAWPYVPCIDQLDFPHIKNDQIETSQLTHGILPLSHFCLLPDQQTR